MSTLRKAIYDIKEMFNAYSDDAYLTDEHIAYMIISKRATYISNYLSSLKKEVPQIIKQLICVNLVEDDLCEDDFLILRSTNIIPSTIEASGRSNITEVFLNSRLAKYINIIDYIRLPFIKNGRYNKNQVYICIDPNGYLIVASSSINHELLEDVKLNIVAEDPEEAYEFQCNKTENKCDFYDAEFPIELGMLNLIKKEILNELLLKYRIQVDTINNSEDDTVNQNNNNDRRK